jgi:carboxyl-terminal processing protease
MTSNIFKRVFFALVLGTSPFAFGQDANTIDTMQRTGKAEQMLSGVMQAIKADYVKPVAEQSLLDSCAQALDGIPLGTSRVQIISSLSDLDKSLFEPALDKCLKVIVRGLDIDSVYYSKTEMQKFSAVPAQQGSLGFGLFRTANGVVVTEVIEASSSDIGGLLRGDILLSVDRQDVRNSEAAEVLNLLRGEIGSKAQVVFNRAGFEKPLQVDLVREKVIMASVIGSLIKPNLGYLMLTSFSETTLTDIGNELKILRQKNGISLNQLIIDLRWSKGGLLDTAIALSSLFLNEGQIVASSSGKIGSINHTYRKSSNPRDYSLNWKSMMQIAEAFPEIKTVKLIVLVGSGTASGAELVAAAMQDNHRAKIIGQTTMGRGVLGNIRPIGDAALKLTIGFLGRPNGALIEAAGVTPDIKIDSVQSKDGLPEKQPRKALVGSLEDPVISIAVKSF